MRNIKLTIEYDGTNYYGWQRQPDYKTIQGEIENVLSRITKEDVEIFGSGRTDKGVHAVGQVANFNTNSRMEAHKFKLALNSLLPNDIAIKESTEVDLGFHSRYSGKGKKYKYLIYNNKTRCPMNRLYTYHVFYDLDLDKIKESSKYFIGTHDFCGFMSTKSDKKDTVRTIYSLDVDKKDNIIEISIEGNGFLYNMVRIIAGTLVDVGRGAIDHKDIKRIISSKDRTKGGHTAPPEGLYLWEVYY